MAKKSTARLLIPRGDAFDLAFYDYLSSERFEKIRKMMSNRRYTVGETKVAYRVINHWDQYGLLPKGVKGDGGWRKFTLPEMVWLRVTVRMRDFGLSLEKIALVKNSIMQWDKKLEKYVLFEYYITKAWLSSDDPYVLVLNDGTAEVATSTEIEAATLLLDSFDRLLISLKSILKDMDCDVSEKKILLPLSDKEIDLLSSVSMENNKEVQTKLDERGEMTEIESTEIITDPLEQRKIKHRVKQGKMYGKIVTQYEEGLSKSTKLTKRTKFKS